MTAALDDSLSMPAAAASLRAVAESTVVLHQAEMEGNTLWVTMQVMQCTIALTNEVPTSMANHCCAQDLRRGSNRHQVS
jgi:hypothetical protein